MSHLNRVVLLIDMDCFYCQVEEQLDPKLKGKPIAVVQYNAWKGGGIIAVNYEARKYGVTRHMRGDEAKKKCPIIELVSVPNVREKADLSKYRDAGKVVAKILQRYTSLLERASVDEAYLDITEAVDKQIQNSANKVTLDQLKNTFVANGDTAKFLNTLYNSGLYEESNLKLAAGAAIADQIRSTVFEETGYTCSAGIAHNKILAKLASGFNKPNKQTILSHNNVQEVYKTIPIQKIPGLGGKFGSNLVEVFGIKNVADLKQCTETSLRQIYDQKIASWLYNIARGINLDPVTTRLVSTSIGCCKKFPGKSALRDETAIKHWLNQLALEIVDRLEKDYEENQRRPKHMIVSFSQEIFGQDKSSSRTHNLQSYELNRITSDAFEIIERHCQRKDGTFCIKFLGISMGKFEDCRNVNKITSFFNSDLVDNKSEKDNYTNIGENPESPANIELLTENKDESDSSSENDSISNEIGCNVVENESTKSSFFLNYFDRKPNVSPVKRDFDSSRIWEETMDDNLLANPDTDIAQIPIMPLISAPELYKPMIPTIPLVPVATSSNSTHVNNVVPNIRIPVTDDNKAQLEMLKSVKMRINPILEKFLNSKKVVNEENTKTCPQCHKLIVIENFQNHLDYHLAMKLHMAINPRQDSKEFVTQTTISRKRKPKQTKKTDLSVKSIKSFFNSST